MFNRELAFPSSGLEPLLRRHELHQDSGPHNNYGCSSCRQHSAPQLSATPTSRAPAVVVTSHTPLRVLEMWCQNPEIPASLDVGRYTLDSTVCFRCHLRVIVRPFHTHCQLWHTKPIQPYVAFRYCSKLVLHEFVLAFEENFARWVILNRCNTSDEVSKSLLQNVELVPTWVRMIGGKPLVANEYAAASRLPMSQAAFTQELLMVARCSLHLQQILHAHYPHREAHVMNRLIVKSLTVETYPAMHKGDKEDNDQRTKDKQGQQKHHLLDSGLLMVIWQRGQYPK
mmetsp:Transcript_58855/g.137477  ORF Transcript_58855/g.137477 Transcript_58855/m.137477 type:complete len:284 (-) Transcript_58855:423-1274(-)